MMKNAGRHGEREHGNSVMIDHEDRAGRPAEDKRVGAAWSRLLRRQWRGMSDAPTAAWPIDNGQAAGEDDFRGC